MANEARSQKRRGRLEWEFQLGVAHRTLQFWRGLAIVMSVATVILIYSIERYEQEPKLVPYVVEVSGDQISFKGVVQPTALTATRAAVIHYLKRFITDLVSVTTDPVALKEQLSDTYSIATPQAQELVTRYIRKTDPFKAAQKGEHIDVRFVWFQPQAQRTWQAEWVEEIWDGGTLESAPTVIGTFTYTTQFLASEAEAAKNPFGIFVDWFALTNEQR